MADYKPNEKPVSVRVPKTLSISGPETGKGGAQLNKLFMAFRAKIDKDGVINESEFFDIIERVLDAPLAKKFQEAMSLYE